MIKQLDDILSKCNDDYSGAILVKQKDTILLQYSGGYAHKGFRVANTTDTMFDTASVTKVFTATAIMQLIDCGLLHLEDRITDIIDLEGTEITKDVRIKHLLTHTSGIADDADEEAGEDYTALFINTPNYSIRNCSDFLPQFAYKPPNFAPGTNVRYNNCGFILLGLAIEKVSKMNYREYIRTNIFEACGMSNSRFCAMDEVNSNTAEGYISITDNNDKIMKWKKNIYSYPPVGTADGGAYTTVKDLDIFVQSIITNKLLSEANSEQLFQPHCIHSRPHRLGIWRTGYGFEFIEDNDGRIICIYKEGVNAGVEAMCSYYPSQDITVNLLSNQNGCLFKIHRQIQNLIVACLSDL